MGNCITFRRVVSWVDDDGEWDFLQPENFPPKFEENDHHPPITGTKSTESDELSKPKTSAKNTESEELLKPKTSAKNTESEELFEPNSAESPSSTMVLKSAKPTSTHHEVRIKITKKQLAEMLRHAENRCVPTQDLLASLIETATARPNRVIMRRRIGQCWRPGLQSIPEIVE